MRARLLSPLLPVVAALAVAGCGAEASEDSTGDFQGEQQAVAQVVEDLQEAGRERDGNEICSRLLTEALRASVQQASGASCAKAMDDVLDDTDAFEIQVDRVTVSGTTATVAVTGEGGDQERKDTLTLEKVGQAWRISGLS